MKYHAVCRVNYQNRAYAVACEKNKDSAEAGNIGFKMAEPEFGESSSSGGGNWHSERYLHNQAFEALKTYISDRIVDKKEGNKSYY